MPRKARIDAPGALHHVICRGIERKCIFRDDVDRDDFISRLGVILPETSTRCYAWALIPNHFHLLLKTGSVPVATVMRRLLTGYAVTFNRRHSRHGHLFQNRYKSILCQEEPYLLELVRYIHLNPIRASIVASVAQLDSYSYCGHSRLMGRFETEWQATDEILSRFGARVSSAREKYTAFVEEGAAQGKKPELVGGGMVRSAGGWRQLKLSRALQLNLKSDERILGDGDFVDSVLREAAEDYDRRQRQSLRGYDLNTIVGLTANLFELDTREVMAGGKQPKRVQARSLACYWAVRELGMSTTALATQIGLTQSAVSRAVQRGERLARERGYQLEERGNA
jgi:REP element-mobilizing transposase RayT